MHVSANKLKPECQNDGTWQATEFRAGLPNQSKALQNKLIGNRHINLTGFKITLFADVLYKFQPSLIVLVLEANFLPT